MKRISTFLSVALAVGLIAACQQTEQAEQIGATEEAVATDVESARTAIETANQTFESAILAGDAAAIGALFAEDAILLAPGTEPIEGRAGIESHMAKGLEEMPLTGFTLNDERIEVVGDIAYNTGTYTVEATGPDGATISEEGKYLTVYRNIDGQWLIVADTWNSNEMKDKAYEADRAKDAPAKDAKEKDVTAPATETESR